MCSPLQTIDQLSGIQAELQESVKELAKAKKKYYDCEQVAHAVREKADIEAKWVPQGSACCNTMENSRGNTITTERRCQLKRCQAKKI